MRKRRTIDLLRAEAKARALPKHFAEDLDIDARWIGEHPAGAPFVWVLRTCGTEVVFRDEPGEGDWAPDKLFALKCEIFGGNPEFLVYIFEGGALRPADRIEALRWLEEGPALTTELQYATIQPSGTQGERT